MKSTPHTEDSAMYVIAAAMQDAAADERFDENEQAAFVADFGYDIRHDLPREIETCAEADELYEKAYAAARQLAGEIAEVKMGIFY